jgi:hypothetical protein
MLIKHKLFLVPIIASSETYNLDVKVLEEINQFLAEDNYVYLSHSISTIGRDMRPSPGSYRSILLAISLVYKDLNNSPNQIKEISTKSKKIVRKSIESEADIPMPQYKTAFDVSSKKGTKNAKK